MSKPRSLAEIKTLLMDMDGVVYHGDTTPPGVQAFLAFLRENDISAAFVTNGTNSWPEDHRRRLADLGIDVDGLPVYTAGLATADYLASIGPGLRAYVIGGDGFRQLVVQRGQCVLDAENPDVVVVGWTPSFDYQQLETACLAIYHGAQLVVGDPDVNDPSPRGPLPGSGAFAAAIEAATGVEGLAIGKPNRILFESALHGLDAHPDHTAMLGDRLDSDVAGGLRVGLHTIVVLTGYTTREMIERSPTKPDRIVRDLVELREAWSRALGDR